MNFIIPATIILSMLSSSWLSYSDRDGLVSYELPSSWNVQTEPDLESSQVISPPYPAYMLIAGDEPAILSRAAFESTYGEACPTGPQGHTCPYPPSDYALHPVGQPWFEVLVTTEPVEELPSVAQAYDAFPTYIEELWEMEGVRPVKGVDLTKPVEVHNGGLAGTQARIEIEVKARPSTEVNSEAFVKGNEVWMVIDGCTVSCYDQNAHELGNIINSVRVGTATM
jgi:hypothetical protein